MSNVGNKKATCVPKPHSTQAMGKWRRPSIIGEAHAESGKPLAAGRLELTPTVICEETGLRRKDLAETMRYSETVTPRGWKLVRSSPQVPIDTA
jgi:hypothetical protein